MLAVRGCARRKAGAPESQAPPGDNSAADLPLKNSGEVNAWSYAGGVLRNKSTLATSTPVVLARLSRKLCGLPIPWPMNNLHACNPHGPGQWWADCRTGQGDWQGAMHPPLACGPVVEQPVRWAWAQLGVPPSLAEVTGRRRRHHLRQSGSWQYPCPLWLQTSACFSSAGCVGVAKAVHRSPQWCGGRMRWRRQRRRRLGSAIRCRDW